MELEIATYAKFEPATTKPPRLAPLTRAAHWFCRAVTPLGYEVETRGLENLPEGAAIIAPNHVCYADALFVMRAAGRPVRFVMDRTIFSHPLLKTFCSWLKVIPVSDGDRRNSISAFVRTSREALANRETVCIFPEGMVTRDGKLNEFRRGITMLAQGSDAPIIPTRISGAWGSALSYAHGPLLTRLPSLFRRKITVTFGNPLPANSAPSVIRDAVESLPSCSR